MASCITEQLVTAQPQVRLTVSTYSSNTTSVTYSWILTYITGSAYTLEGAKTYSVYADGTLIYEGSFVMQGKTGTVVMANGTHTINKLASDKTVIFSFIMNWDIYWNYQHIPSQTASLEMVVPARTSYTITYNANGGSGAPVSQTKIAGTALTLSTTEPVRTGYTFEGWSTSSTATSATYSAGSSFTNNADTTLYAVWSKKYYIIQYDANGGTGGPSAQVKLYGTTLTISSTKPTRSGYVFSGWGVSSVSTNIAYYPGGTYTQNASITLYAVWTVDYEPPYVMDLVVDRCTSSGVLADDGTYLKASFNWSADVTVTSMQARWSTTESFSSYSSYKISHSGTALSGSKSSIIFGGGAINIENVYYVRVYVTDSLGGSSYYQVLVPSMKFTIDCLSGGKGVSFGKVATKENTLDTDWDLIVGGKTELVDVDAYHIVGASADIGGTLTASSIEAANSITTRFLGCTFSASLNKTTITTANINTLYDIYSTEIRNGLCAYESTGIDPDTTLEHEILTSTNTPNGAFMYIITYFYSSKSSTSNRMQIAFPYNKAEGPYYRYYLSGTWSSWMRIGSHIHATTEKVTGDTWTDGKPIYRRVVTGSVSTLNADTVVGTISNMDTVVDFHGTVKRSSGSMFGMTYYASSSDYHRAWVKSNGEVTIRTATAVTVRAIVDYTKTTD